MAAPLCRSCGKPIAKATHLHWFGESSARTNWSTSHPELPKDKAEAQRLTNRQIISVRYWTLGGEKSVRQATTWDGESYRDAFFCKNECAQRFGYAALAMNPNLGMDAYHEAVAARETA